MCQRHDGASELRIFFKIALPLMVPGLMTVLLLSVVGTWNNYILPLIIFSDNTLYQHVPHPGRPLHQHHRPGWQVTASGSGETTRPFGKKA
jgi:ABC-type glycerol-3-phosphate transport system permease component